MKKFIESQIVHFFCSNIPAHAFTYRKHSDRYDQPRACCRVSRFFLTVNVTSFNSLPEEINKAFIFQNALNTKLKK